MMGRRSKDRGCRNIWSNEEAKMVEEQNDSGQPQQSETTSQTTPVYSQETSGSGSGGKTSSGLEPNLAALLAYLFGWISGLIFFLIEKDNKYVRFHALQSILLNVAMIVIYIGLVIVSIVLRIIPVLGAIIAGLLWLLIPFVFLAAVIILMIKAYQGEMFKLPIIGDIAEKNA
jgi:uncharacterized membrane protein